MTQETIYAELKKMQLQLIPHIQQSIEQQRPGANLLVLTEHHLALAVHYFTQKLKNDEIPEPNQLQDH